MLLEMADSVGLVMLANGDDPGTVTDESFNAAADRVQAAVDSGQIVRFTGNDFAQPLTSGEFAASVAWSGKRRSTVRLFIRGRTSPTTEPVAS